MPPVLPHPNPTPLTLNIDTAGETCRLWLTTADGVVVAQRAELVGKHHESHLLPLLRQLLDQAAVGLPDLGAVTVVASPGSYTSLRVGVASAKALALALNLPLQLQTA
jgi:tRNA threonylcarbamoyladenosine biosynthesis protein TsaB